LCQEEVEFNIVASEAREPAHADRLQCTFSVLPLAGGGCDWLAKVCGIFLLFFSGFMSEREVCVPESKMSLCQLDLQRWHMPL
jgi:hypothetical protein